MIRLPLRPLLSLLLVLLPIAATAQTAVPTHEEPRHRLVLETPAFRVLDVRIPPGDTTLFHRHSLPMAFTLIGATTTRSQILGNAWDAPIPNDAFPLGTVLLDESYPESPTIHRVANIGSREFRVIAVLNRGPGSETRRTSSLGSAGPVLQEGRWFRNSELTLRSGGSLEWEGHDRPVVAVQFSPGRWLVETNGENREVLDQAGSWVVLNAGGEYVLRSRGSAPVSIAFIEVR